MQHPSADVIHSALAGHVCEENEHRRSVETHAHKGGADAEADGELEPPVELSENSDSLAENHRQLPGGGHQAPAARADDLEQLPDGGHHAPAAQTDDLEQLASQSSSADHVSRGTSFS